MNRNLKKPIWTATLLFLLISLASTSLSSSAQESEAAPTGSIRLLQDLVTSIELKDKCHLMNFSKTPFEAGFEADVEFLLIEKEKSKDADKIGSSKTTQIGIRNLEGQLMISIACTSSGFFSGFGLPTLDELIIMASPYIELSFD